jgi:hypothetical protein
MKNIPKYSLLSFTIFFDLEEIIFENFNISENNIISVELAKVLGLYGVLWTCKENTSFFWHLSHCIRFLNFSTLLSDL